MEINDIEYQCWHEVGHAIACMLNRGEVVSIELSNDQKNPYLAKASCKTPERDMRLATSAGGFAIEYALYTSNKINIPEKEFLIEVMINSSNDRKKFCHNENLTKSQCEEIFINYAKNISEEFLLMMDKLEKIVTQLMQKKKLTGNEIASIFNS